MKRLVYNKSGEERNRLRNRIAELLHDRKEIIFAYDYGSFAEGAAFHDIDLGVFVSGLSEVESIRYMLELSHGASAEFGMPVDVRILNFAPVTFTYHVIQGDLLVDNDEEIRSQFVEGVIRKYLDLKPRIRMAIKEAFAS